MAPVSVIAILPLLVLLASVIGGITLIVLSRRGRREHPACGGCGYDITGSVGSVVRCPECGAEFTEVGINPRRRGRPLMLTSGILLLVFAFGCVGLSVFTFAAHTVAPAPAVQTVPAIPAPIPAPAQTSTDAPG